MFFAFDGCGSGTKRAGWGPLFAEGGPWNFGFGPGGRRRGFRGGRMFEQGDLKYVILQLLADKPRHGYEIIKALEEKSGGAYAPSAGTVYPTLQLLEDMGYAASVAEEGGKKIYTITEEGRRYLEQNKTAVDDVFERIADMGQSFLSDAVMSINKAIGGVAKATYEPVTSYHKNRVLADQVRQILDRAADEIRAATKAAREKSEPEKPESPPGL